MWLAESYQYSPDYKTLTIKTRKEAMWSDGVPFTADDVVYTYNTLNTLGAKAKWGADVQQVLDSAQVIDPQTAQLNFKIPAPRFFEYSAYKYDIGIYMMPKHIFEKQSVDMATFPHFDVSKDWPVTTSPWKVVYAAPDQKVLDLRDKWWGTGIVAPMPKAQRIVYLPDPGEQNLAQGMISNAFDIVTGIQPTTFPTVFAQNPKVTTWAGQQAPFGYQDWWPHSLYVNTRSGPTADADVRWAISSYIDRDQIVDFSWAGAASTAALPLPQYPGTQQFYDASQCLLQQYNTLEYNPSKGDAILQSKGFSKGPDGIWVAPDGTPMKFDITSFFDFTSVGPVLVEQFKRAGIATTYSEPPNFFNRFGVGDYTMALFGHGGSYGPDPFYTLRLYQSSSEAIRRPPGQLLALAKRRIRRHRRRYVSGQPDREGPHDPELGQSDADLVAPAARHHDRAGLPPPADQRDVLDRLAERAEPICQQRVLPPHARADRSPVAANRRLTRTWWRASRGWPSTGGTLSFKCGLTTWSSASGCSC